MGRHTIGPALSGLGEGLAGRDVLVSSLTGNSCGGLGAVYGCQVYSVFSDTLVQLASGFSGHCVKKQCGLVGLCCVSKDAQLSTCASPESVWEMQRRDKTNYQLDTTEF